MIFDTTKALFSYNKEKYECILDDPRSKLGIFLDKIILFLVLLFPIILAFESIGDNGARYSSQIYIIDAIISMIFAAEYFYRFFESGKKLKFLVHPMRIIDLLSFIPFFLGFVVIGEYLKLLRILRILRILELFKQIPLTSGFIKALKDYSDEYRAVFTIYFIFLFLGSFFVYYIESKVPGSDFTSIPEALRWGLVTTSTVGYGDVTIQTVGGKIIGSILVFLGPILGGLFSAVTIMVFMETSKEQELMSMRKKGKSCPRCGVKNSNVSNYCMVCGKMLVTKNQLH